MIISVDDIDSSNIKALSWNSNTDWNCNVIFNNNSVYSYKLVPIDNFLSVIRAKSIGSTFNDLIKTQFEAKNLNGAKQ